MERWMVLSLLVSLFLTTEAAISVTKLHVQSVITHRFSTTTVKSLLINEGEEAQEATFDVRLPKDAFISNFSMLIDGQVYPGEIAEKEKARKIYQAAVEQGQSAGHVRASPRQSNKFAVSVNVEAGNNVTFDLTYQELLVRRLGVYEHVIYIDPGQIVEDLMVEVYISESRVITELSVPRITNDLLTDEIIDDTNDLAMIEMLSESSAYVSFWPAEDEQERFSAQGISGQFIVNYDVEHESDGVGEILVSDGYFVHYFAPVWLEPINKRIMFVLDTSGSMSGTKINQLKQALVTILEELNPADEFGIITFSSGVNPWKGGEILPASERIVQSAIEYAGELRASGGTNIDMAMERGLHILSQYSKETASMLIFLTDGQATSGETRDSKILENIRASNKDKFASIFCLGFGRGADFGLLQKIAGQNNGVARKIFEDADASLQLAGFYDEISSPLLSELKITYIGGIDNTSLTETDLHCLFDGSEMVVAGRLNVDYHNYSSVNNTGPVMNLTIEGNHVNTLVVGGQIDLVDTYIEDIPKLSPESIRDFTHRLWVYLTIKQLIDTTQQTTDPDKAKLAKAKALELSLRYGFVTPFTSMVVTKPGDEDKKEVVGEDKGVSHFEAERAPSGRSRPNYPVYAQSLPVPQSGSQGVYHSAVSYNSPGSYHSPALSWNPPQSGPVGMAGLPARPTTLPPATYTTTTTPARLYTYAATRGKPGGGLRVNMKKKKKMPRPPRPTAPVSYDYHAPSGNKKKAKKTPKGNVYGPAIAIETLPQKGSANNRRVLCFDLPKDLTQSTLSLLQTNDLNLTGTPSSSYGDAKKFNEITLRAANKTLVFTSKGVTVDSGKLAAWWRLKFMKVDGWKVLADGVLRIQFGSNSSLVIQKHGIQSRRSRAKPFLTLGISPVDGDIQGASGILGDLFRPQYLSIKRNKVYFDAQKAQVSPFDKYKLPTGRKCFRLLKMDTVKQLLKI